MTSKRSATKRIGSTLVVLFGVLTLLLAAGVGTAAAHDRDGGRDGDRSWDRDGGDRAEWDGRRDGDRDRDRDRDKVEATDDGDHHDGDHRDDDTGILGVAGEGAGCDVTLDFRNFDVSDTNAVASFWLWPPTGRFVKLASQPVFVGQDPPGGDQDADGSLTVDLTSALASHQPSTQGYHVKVAVFAPGAHGVDVEHKVFWLSRCGSTQPVETTTTSSTTTTTTEPVMTSTITGESSRPSVVDADMENAAAGSPDGPRPAMVLGLVGLMIGALAGLRLVRQRLSVED